MSLLTFVLLFSSAHAGSYGKAKKAGTATALRDFAEQNDEHPKAIEALERADALDWAAAEALNTEDGYHAYLDASPGGNWSEEALQRADRLSWAATSFEDAPALRAHLDRYPDGTHQYEGRKALETMDLAAAQQEGSVQALVTHFERYPRHASSQQVLGEILRKMWVDLQGTIDAGGLRAELVVPLGLRAPKGKVAAESLPMHASAALVLGHFDEAQALLQLAVAYDDQQPSTWIALAEVDRFQEDFAAEERHLARAAELPRCPRDAVHAEALLRVRQGRHDEARELLQSVATVASTNWSVKMGVAPKFPNPDAAFYLSRAALYQAEGKDIAWRDFETAVERLTSHPALLQAQLVEHLRLDPVFAGLRADERFVLPEVEAD